MTALGALADAHPRVVFAIAMLIGSAGVISFALGAVLAVAGRLAERDERLEDGQ